MTPKEALAMYAQGWIKGDPSLHMKCTSPSFTFDDPNAGRIAKAKFEAYFADLKKAVEAARRGKPASAFMDLSEVVAKPEDDGSLSVWCWWAIRGTPFAGSGLIKVGEDGVRSEKIAYYTKLPG